MELNENPLDENQNEEVIQEEQTTQETLNEEVQEEAVVEESDEEVTNEDQPKKKRKRGSRGGSGNAKKTKELEENIEKLNEELSEMKDKYLRLYADFDNYRKRTNKERLELIQTASKDVILSVLPVIDDFERAIKVGDSDDSEEKLPEGVRLIYDKMVRLLGQKGLQAMETTGETFDSDIHEALTKVPVPSEDMKGKIIDTVEKGYKLGEKIIRYPKVVVGQ